jgi:hypothetical protein
MTAVSVNSISANTTVDAVATAVGHQHEERDPAAGAEDHDGAEHVQIFDEKIQCHRFWAAIGG